MDEGLFALYGGDFPGSGAVIRRIGEIWRAIASAKPLPKPAWVINLSKRLLDAYNPVGSTANVSFNTSKN